ncbi:hypothetical protein SAMD00019534_064230 [Acytostelium subglobosum LB1]|uniref:hypothetical protein n=1 Tax=Acytostelium subglobosum LB1 TaxID=1410327 RepID=UPI000644CE5F|nr:hypothetical protein SAMD00019534_064230 [Acytostelium subglobosum LB1]GAM23248.1 hypothetical protein SAMD00019534_064230 [Acytostelium subglobosum LB1]|eukprot:XP_012753697.1 hypothetical protein SAMD00019534_064230 [Acytostelium subglobosum LB1]
MAKGTDKGRIPLRRHTFPSTLTGLTISYGYHVNPFNKVLPEGLKRLDLSYAQYHNDSVITGGLPSTLETLILTRQHSSHLKPGSLPLGLKSLIIESSYEHVLDDTILPRSLTHLNLKGGHTQPLGKLPDSLTDLSIELFGTGIISHRPLIKLLLESYQTLNPDIIFEHLKDLTFFKLRTSDISSITSTRFPNLRDLSIVFPDVTGNGLIDLSGLPSSIRRLTLWAFHLQSPYGPIPNGVEEVNLYGDHAFDAGIIPTSVTSLFLQGVYLTLPAKEGDAVPWTIPPSVRKLQIHFSPTPAIHFLPLLPMTIQVVGLTIDPKKGSEQLRRISETVFFIMMPSLMDSGFIDVTTAKFTKVLKAVS